MENFFNSLPKPLLALLVLVGALVFFMLNDPPKTICDVQKDNMTEDLKGKVFPIIVKKKTIPPILDRAQQDCQDGNSTGSCLEYFEILRTIAKGIHNSSSDCREDVLSMDGVKPALTTGVILMAKMAWGSHPPEPDASRFGWFQESELKLFCELRDAYTAALGDEAWGQLRQSIYNNLPGEAPKNVKTANVTDQVPRAVTTLSDKDMWTRSLFSLRCENYR